MYAAVILSVVNFDYYPTHIYLPLNPPEVFIPFYDLYITFQCVILSSLVWFFLCFVLFFGLVWVWVWF